VRHIVRNLALAGMGVLLSLPTSALETCDSRQVLVRAHDAYQALDALSDTARYTIRVPGASPHHETTEFGFDRTFGAVLRMPGLYLITVTGGRLYLSADRFGGADRFLTTRADATLQTVVDAAFDGHGPPLVPVRLSWRVREDGLPRSGRSRFIHRSVGDCL
jgi:hypothetical protein